MDVRSESKPECSECDGQSYVQSSRTRRAPETKMFVADMSRVRNGADHPGRQTPDLYMTGRHGKHDPYGSVHDTKNYRRPKPRLPG